MHLITPHQQHSTDAPATGVLQLPNDAELQGLELAGVTRIELHFPKFNDGRAFSQAVTLRRRLGYSGELRATGDVLVDQVVQMHRSGFDSAVLRADQDPEVARRQFARFDGFYQGDVRSGTPHFRRAMSSAVTSHARASADFMGKLQRSRDALLALALEHARAPGADTPRIVQASSLGAEDMVISHLIDALELDVGIFVLQTGMLHAETLTLLDRLRIESRAPVTVYEPQAEAAVQFVQREGKDAMFKSIALRKACCGIRKMEPLARALDGKSAWITGLRREQSGARAEVPLHDRSDPARVKLNPLAEWTWGDVWHYIGAHGVAYNPLHDQFFPSIGCAPCTRAISLGEDFRAGRWWWEDESAKECGLHVVARNESIEQQESHA